MHLLYLPVEILIAILEHVGRGSVATLLLAQRTCRAFRDLIRCTRSLQVALYLRAARPDSATAGGGGRCGGGGGSGGVAAADDDGDGSKQTVSPLIFSRFKALLDKGNYPDLLHNDDYTNGGAWTGIDGHFRSLPWAGSAASRAPVLRPDASWRRMLLANSPPVTSLTVIQVTAARAGPTPQSATTWSFAQKEVVLAGGAPLDMGTYYDVLLAPGVHHEHRHVRMRLFLGQRALPGRLDEGIYCLTGRSEPGSQGWLEPAPDHALLYMVTFVDPLVPSKHWRPQSIGQPPKILTKLLWVD